MSRYIGATGGLPPSYFYKLTRDASGYLVFTKIDLNADGTAVVVNNNAVSTDPEQQQQFDIGSDVVVINVDANHELINQAAGHSQYKIKPEDLVYFINDSGDMIVRINGSYDYPAIV
jgi:hypothetical protein